MQDTPLGHLEPAASNAPRAPAPSIASATPALPVHAAAPLARAASRADHVYSQLRDDIFEMRLLPGDRITEGGVAERFEVSRTPAREALQRLQSDGLMQGYVRGGWEVVPIDFKRFDDLYEMRELIETFALRKICGASASDVAAMLDALEAVWSVPPAQRVSDGRDVAALDEAFHQALVDATGNGELMSALRSVTDRIRIVRRLDFVYGNCIASTYDEHAAILRAVREHRTEDAVALLESHIRGSRASVRTLTLHRLHGARTSVVPVAPGYAPARQRRTI
jgi:DNA-binding GntR family transcriptional regulator